MGDVNGIQVDITLSPRDEAIAEEILGEAGKGVVSWRELVEKYRGRGVSLYRLRKILLALLSRNQIVELQCRLFTTPGYLEKTPREVLREQIASKIRELGLQKCGKPVGIPYEKITITITRDGRIGVTIR